MRPSKADADSFKSFQHAHHTLVVKFVGGTDYGVCFLFSKRESTEAVNNVYFKENIFNLNTFFA